MASVNRIHNWNVSKARKGPFSKWNLLCSCGHAGSGYANEGQARLQAIDHVRLELDRARRIAQATTPTPPTASTKESTVRDVADRIDHIVKTLGTTKTSAQSMYDRAAEKLTDEDQALSPTEYEYWLVQQAKASGVIEVLQGIEDGLK